MGENSRGHSARRSIVIVGFMAAGKTTVGQLLSAQLAMPFVDADLEIERQFGCTVPIIFERHGEIEFRSAERALILSLLADEPKVLSIGGGAYVDEEISRKINAEATSVWLDPPFDLILDRLARSTERPLALGRSADELKCLWQERRKSYREAHFHIEVSDPDPHQAVKKILQVLS